MCIQNPSTFSCQQCEKSFSTSGNLKTHKEKVHGGGSPLPCPHCGKSFQYMESHIKNVHEIRSEVFNCEECDKDEKESAVNKNDGKYDITDQQSDEKPDSIEDNAKKEYIEEETDESLKLGVGEREEITKTNPFYPNIRNLNHNPPPNIQKEETPTGIFQDTLRSLSRKRRSSTSTT